MEQEPLTRPTLTNPNPSGWRLWAWWVLGSLSGAVLGAIVGFALAYLIFGGEAPGVPLLVAGAIAGGWFGAAQWAILRDYLPTLNGPAWVAVTAVAGAVVWTVAGDAGRAAFLTLLGEGAGAVVWTVAGDAGQAAFLTLLGQGFVSSGPESQPLLLLLGTTLGGVIGLAVGLGQWLLLRASLPRAGWWPLAYAGAGAAGLGLGLSSTPYAPRDPYWFILLDADLLVGVVLAVLLACALTGLVLVWGVRARRA